MPHHWKTSPAVRPSRSASGPTAILPSTPPTPQAPRRRGPARGSGSDRHGRSACWGELFSAAAKGRGAAGVVCDGYVRDRAKILDLDFPVFALGTRPVDYRARMRVAAVQEPVTCGGVLITPGDPVPAEDDGVVAVPRARDRHQRPRQHVRRDHERLPTEGRLSPPHRPAAPKHVPGPKATRSAVIPVDGQHDLGLVAGHISATSNQDFLEESHA
ncbi:hypothetical protein ACIBQ6_00050 [Nonomuraea sp. NPDC049655]|uniref:RraA family protein n=1 Tax=Nonomuraea sp. NPDC049655 TaxID=3364355 RepID=UPI0037A7C849